ncbi:unnamed protein product [Discosporangium mesarthrocarpum]
MAFRFRLSSVGKGFLPATRGLATVTTNMVAGSEVDAQRYVDFIKDQAFFPNPPRRMSTLLQVLQHKGLSLVDPAERAGLNPFFIPLAKDEKGEMTGLLRWPTAPETMEMAVVKHSTAGLDQLSLTAEHFVRRAAAEEDFTGGPDAKELIRLANEGLNEGDQPYEAGAAEKLGYGIMRYNALRIGAFADVYEWLTAQHLDKGDVTAALSCAERANDLFVGWGRPYGYYARTLGSLGKSREMEAKDAAKVALRCACWTISPDPAHLEEVVRIAGYTDMDSVREMYTNMASDEQKDKIIEGKAPMQVALDRAAHLMDAAAFGYKGWDDIREELAQRYEEGGLPEIATFVRL